MSARLEEATEGLALLLVPDDPADEREAIIEARVRGAKTAAARSRNRCRTPCFRQPEYGAERELWAQVRAGTGGDEAALFAGDLLKMYERYVSAYSHQQHILPPRLACVRRPLSAPQARLLCTCGRIQLRDVCLHVIARRRRYGDGSLSSSQPPRGN